LGQGRSYDNQYNCQQYQNEPFVHEVHLSNKTIPRRTAESVRKQKMKKTDKGKKKMNPVKLDNFDITKESRYTRSFIVSQIKN
jgi:hypothetical protein